MFGREIGFWGATNRGFLPLPLDLEVGFMV
jgi:hypothetical protein